MIGVIEIEALLARRRRNWCQDGERRVADPADALKFIERVGVATLYGASPEFPSLYQAYMSDPNPPSFATWDSPSGEVYGWRWALGRPHSAFYGVIVAKKPTWAAFRLLPTVIGALMERRTPEELYEAGELSANARRIAEAFDGTEGVLSTADLRTRAGFEKGKANRAAYLKAVEELDARLWLAKRFAAEEGPGDEMLHALVDIHYAEAAAAGRAMDPADALMELLGEILKHSVFLDPKPLGRHLNVSVERLRRALDQLVNHGRAVTLARGRDVIYVSTEEEK
jgi:hypothetical protein